MKILLIQPAKPEKAIGGEDFSIFEPLALEYLAAALSGDHEIRILDMRIDHDLAPVLDEYRPDIVGITSYTVHVETVKRLFRQVKAHNPSVLTVVGGPHATVMPEDFSTPFIDIIVAGDGISPFRGIVSCLEKEGDMKDISGAVALGDGNILIDNGEEAADLDLAPFPRRDLTADYRHAYFSEWMKPLASIRTSKGCLFRCRFCALWKQTGGRYLTRKPECIVEEMTSIKEKYVFFADDESLLDVERMKNLADLIIQAGLGKRFFLYGRSDTIVKYPGLIERWKEAGLERVFVGLESFRDRDLKQIRKGSTVENNGKAIQMLKGLGIDIFPTFIVQPDFDRQDFRDLRKYCLQLSLPFIGFTVLTPLPGTELYHDVKDSLVASSYDYFDFFHALLPTKLPLKDFYEEFALLYRRSRSLKNRIRLMRKHRLRELPALFKAYGQLMNRLANLERDYLEDNGDAPFP